MINCRKKIALIYGGRGCEHSVSVRGAEYVKDVLSKEKYYTYSVFIDKKGVWWLDGAEVFPARHGGISGLSDGERIFPIDCAIPLLHGDFGEDGRIQGALDTAGIPFVGADTVTGAICLDKAATGSIAQRIGIPTARGVLLSHGAVVSDSIDAAKRIGFPVFIKPRRLGSSIGAAVARSESELCTVFPGSAIHGDLLIEELIEPKRELEIGLLSLKGQRILSPIGEVMCDGFYDYDKKYERGTVTVCPADVGDTVSERIREYAIRLSDAIPLYGPSRIDFFLSGERVIFNEINTLPGFTKDSLYPTLMRAAGVDVSRLFDLLIEDAIGI